jgi:hypothetical protein
VFRYRQEKTTTATKFVGTRMGTTMIVVAAQFPPRTHMVGHFCC